MKIVVIGGTGLIGSKVVSKLNQAGHDVIAASPSSGINTITGAGLAEALAGADVVVDLANSPSFEDKAAMDFFRTSGKNLLAAEAIAGVKLHVALSIVGVDLMEESGYMRAKIVQEELIEESGIPYTIVRSTQFLEFIPGVAGAATKENEVHLSTVKFQPIAADDVAGFVAQAAQDAPVNGIIQIAGPERFTIAGIVERYLKDIHDPREVVENNDAQYFGAQISDSTLVPAGKAKLGATHYEKWLAGQLQHA